MLNKIKKYFKGNSYKKRIKDIDPDEIFLDSENLPKFNTNQFEGRLEKPITINTFFIFSIFCILIFSAYLIRAYNLQVTNGESYLDKSENNRLKNTLVFSNRGVIYDRNENKLAWNVSGDNNEDFSLRKYSILSGLSHVIGYIKYPSKDSSGFYYSEDYIGKDGVEKYYNNILSGKNGLRIVEVDAKGEVQSESVVRPAIDGSDVKLSIDSELQSYVHKTISELAKNAGFTGGAGIIMDVNTGEILTMTSYPEYDSQILTDGNNKNIINNYLTNKNNPFLDRIIDGLYTPGSIVKPYMSVAALSENIINPNTKILSTGSISIPNIYDPLHPSIFKDWKAHGWVDMRHAIAVSSDVYFYEVGGGYENQKGLGISLIDKYMSMFGFGQSLPAGFFNGVSGVIPDPEWKAENFNGEKWNIGNTYHTSIGQYGFQVSPIQAVRAIASVANNGKLLEPSILLGGNKDMFVQLNINPDYFKIVREGMKLGVEEGAASGLNTGYMTLGAKTGTAELGSKKQFVNSWVTGFFPYDNPKYAFAIIMEKGPVLNTIGGVYIMRQVFDWMYVNKPDYLKK
jgi:penicillin-binding protein 2